MAVAIDYMPEAYTTTGEKLMGRHAAGESFLRGLFAHHQSDRLWIRVGSRSHADHFVRAARASGRREPVHVIQSSNLQALAEPGVLQHPAPGIADLAYQRAVHGHARWSLCGVTHTTASNHVMDTLTDLLVAPVQAWDALICTSTAVRDSVTTVLDAQAEHLRRRFGASRMPMPRLPVIPLGLRVADFAWRDEDRAAARRALGADDRTIVVTFLGRLSFHAKAHPLAMYLALERARRATGASVILVECGWHANQPIADAYAQAAAEACPGIVVRTLDGRHADERRTAWAAADVFCSLSDNIQETFGCVPIEAMASGLPVVVSDWNGYKDTVRDGVDGFRIPTIAPQGGLSADLAERHALAIDTYDMYCGQTCSLVAVDVDAAARAFATLFSSASLRQRMGQAGRERARAVYDWGAIIPRYEALWSELAEVRRCADGCDPAPARHPWAARMDPFDAFAGYPTRMLTPATRLALGWNDDGALLVRVLAHRRLSMVAFAERVLPSEPGIAAVLAALADGPRLAGDLAPLLGGETYPAALRSLGWLLKVGALRAQ